MHTVDPPNGTKPFKGITKVSLRIHVKDKNINKKNTSYYIKMGYYLSKTQKKT